jgi:hypothetical protein
LLNGSEQTLLGAFLLIFFGFQLFE